MSLTMSQKCALGNKFDFVHCFSPAVHMGWARDHCSLFLASGAHGLGTRPLFSVSRQRCTWAGHETIVFCFPCLYS